MILYRMLVSVSPICYLCDMSSIVISPKNQQELQFISKLLQRLGVNSKVLSNEDTEDLGLSLLMKETDRSDFATEDEIMSKLKS